MSKYNKFEDFMQSVINEADSKCQSRYHKSLTDAYSVSASITRMVKVIIDCGWWVFVAIVALLVLGPFAFAAASVSFVATPVGAIAVGALAVFGGVGALKILYKNRILPIAVKETGEIYKSDFNAHINDVTYIDNLISRASETLLSKATTLLR